MANQSFTVKDLRESAGTMEEMAKMLNQAVADLESSAAKTIEVEGKSGREAAVKTLWKWTIAVGAAATMAAKTNPNGGSKKRQA